MAIEVEDKWRYKKVRSETASKSAFAYKIKKQIREKNEGSLAYGYSTRANYSREIIVKMTRGAKSKKGIKGAVEYISKDWQEEIIDSQGIKYETKEEMEIAIRILQDNVVASVKSNPEKEVKLTHNIVFSAPKIAEVKKEDALEAVEKVLTEKYPDNYFVMAYHEETKNLHVHVVLNIHKDTGERIDIRKKDLRGIREGFYNNLIKLGYEVKAKRKHGIKPEKHEELLSGENRNIFEVWTTAAPPINYGKALREINGV